MTTQTPDRPLAQHGPRSESARRMMRLLRLGSLALPMLLLAVWAVWSWQIERSRAVRDVQANAELAREYVLRVLQTQEGILAMVEGLVETAEEAHQPPAELHERLVQLSDLPGAPLSAGFIDAAGQLVATSRRIPTMLDLSDSDFFVTLRDKPSDMMHLERVSSRGVGRDTVVVARRRPANAFTGVVFATLPVETFTTFLGRIAQDPSATAGLMRTDGVLLLRHRASDPAIRVASDNAIWPALATADRGSFVQRSAADGVERIFGFAQLQGRPLVVSYGIGLDALRRRWLVSLAPVAALLALAALLGWLTVDRTATALASEDRRRAADARLVEAQRIAALRKDMLAELHHRVKNSLAIMQSLARLPGGGPGSRALDARVLALAKVHDLLHVGPLDSRLDLAAFLRALCASPEVVPPGSRVALELDLDPVELEVERATPVALIAVELIANALRHAFPDGRGGKLRVTLRAPEASGGVARLAVRDDGVGLSPVERRAGLRSGLDLVDALASQVGGRIERLPVLGGGTEVALTLRAADGRGDGMALLGRRLGGVAAG